MGFLDDYEPVEDRLRAFWTEYPSGRVLTSPLPSEPGTHVVLAEVYRNDTDEKAAATGLAQEHVTERGVNATSALENCETSAIGRALANLGYAAKGKRPSREEMSKATRNSGGIVSNPDGEAGTVQPPEPTSDEPEPDQSSGSPSSDTPSVPLTSDEVSTGGTGGTPSIETAHVHDWTDRWVNERGVSTPARVGWVICASCGASQKASKVDA